MITKVKKFGKKGEIKMSTIVDMITGLLIYAGALASYITIVFYNIERRY